jgi:spermidine/putrescine transport system ATP-binding protein
MSDRIAVMNNGQVLQVDSPINIYERPTSRFVAEFIGKTNFLSGMVVAGGSQETNVLLAGESVALPMSESRLSSGDEVTLAVRPEKLQLHHDVPAQNGYRKIALHGQVREAVYAGTDTHYVVVLQSGEEVTVHMRNTFNHNLGEFAPGEKVVITCPAEALRPLAG